MTLFNTIRSAGGGRFVAALASQAGIEPAEAEEAMRAMLSEVGHAIRRTEESGSGAAVVVHAMHDERYARYLERPETLRDPAAVADGEHVLADVMDDEERNDVIRRVAATIGPNEGEVRTMLPLIATLAMAALGHRLRDPATAAPPTDARSDRFDSTLLNTITPLFHHDEAQPEGR